MDKKSTKKQGVGWIVFLDFLAITSLILIAISIPVILIGEPDNLFLIMLGLASIMISIFWFCVFMKTIKLGMPKYWVPMILGNLLLIGPILALIFYKIKLREKFQK
jgi:hypothetical protein